MAYFAENGRELADPRPRVSVKDAEIERLKSALDALQQKEKALKDHILAVVCTGQKENARKADRNSLLDKETDGFLRELRRAVEDKERQSNSQSQHSVQAQTHQIKMVTDLQT